MEQYHKIQTVYKRDPETKYKTLLEGKYSLPEFEYLKDCEWAFTEKVDGTNIRVMLADWGEGFGEVLFGGKTDRAQIPAGLVNHLKGTFTKEKLADVFDSDTCLYGEGFGAKIQKGGGNYSSDQQFVLFDVKVGDWWLKREDIEDIAEKLRIPVVPIIGIGNLQAMAERCRSGFNSTWGDFRAEGIVARPLTELFTRSGQRVITKLKCKDFAR
jgi:hypothetical protein